MIGVGLDNIALFAACRAASSLEVAIRKRVPAWSYPELFDDETKVRVPRRKPITGARPHLRVIRSIGEQPRLSIVSTDSE